MSVVQVEKALHDFAFRKKGSAIVLKGGWGTGKTYLWNSVIEKHRSDFARATYSYVSLFGINSLADLKRSIFESSVPSKSAGVATTKNSVVENIKKLDFSDGVVGLRKIFGYGREAKIPFVGSFSGVIDSIQYSLVTETIVCIDDFERRGNSLAARDVLGLVSNLVEKKNCSVVLILNEGSLKPDDEFFTYCEKVFDYDILFSPSVTDAVSLVFTKSGEAESIVVENITKLKINNIRLLKKILYFTEVIDSLLSECQPAIRQQAYKLLPLVVLAVYGGEKSIVDIDFIINSESISLRALEMEESPEDTHEARKLADKLEYLESYGVKPLSDFDLAIIDLVKKGYADEDTLKVLVKKLDEQIKNTEELSLYYRALDVYHSSFGDNLQEVLEAFDRVLSISLRKLNLYQLGEVASIYESLGKTAQVHEAVDLYFSEVMSSSELADKDDVFQRPRNDYVLQKIDDHFEVAKVVKSLPSILEEAIDGAGLRSSELVLDLADKPQRDFLDFFENYKGKNLSKIVELCLACGKSPHPDDEDLKRADHKIFLKTYQSLMIISGRSLLNKSRVSRHLLKYEKLYETLRRLVEEANLVID